MKVGLLLLTHDGVGRALLAAARDILRAIPLPVAELEMGSQPPERLLDEAGALVHDLDAGDGVLVLTDLFGSTPSNVAARLPGQVRVVSGLNLPMVLKVCNYADLDLQSLAAKAISGGRSGIVPDDEA